jgi:hypothetical protein
VKPLIIVVGVGALGSHFIQFIRNEDAEIKIIDFDRVEQKNILSQFHGRPSVGKSKVVGLVQTMNYLFGTKLDHSPHKLTTSNFNELLNRPRGPALVVDCLDNEPSRKLVQEFCRSESIPCLHGALAPDGAFGRVVWSDSFVIDSEVGAGAATCENGEHLPFIALTSAYLARSAQVFLKTGKKTGFSVTPGGAFCI